MAAIRRPRRVYWWLQQGFLVVEVDQGADFGAPAGDLDWTGTGVRSGPALELAEHCPFAGVAEGCGFYVMRCRYGEA